MNIDPLAFKVSTLKILVSENECLLLNVKSRLQRIEGRIRFLEQIDEMLASQLKLRSLQKKKSRVSAVALKSVRLTTSSTPTEFVLERISPFLSDNMNEWDIYKLCILVNSSIQNASHSAAKKRERFIDPWMIRHALETKVMHSLSSDTALRLGIMNILLPMVFDFEGKFPFRPSPWGKRFMQRSLEAVAKQLKVSPDQLREHVEQHLLNKSRNLMHLDFEKISAEICGDESLATVVFSIARGITIRPRV